jgi:hypothetical protein
MRHGDAASALPVAAVRAGDGTEQAVTRQADASRERSSEDRGGALNGERSVSIGGPAVGSVKGGGGGRDEESPRPVATRDESYRLYQVWMQDSGIIQDQMLA